MKTKKDKRLYTDSGRNYMRSAEGIPIQRMSVPAALSVLNDRLVEIRDLLKKLVAPVG